MAMLVDGKNVCLDALGALAVKMSLHETNGTELTGGAPAYARATIAWSPAAAGVLTMSTAEAIFNVPAGKDVKTIKIWNTAGTVTYADYTLATAESFVAQGTYTVTDATISIT